MRTYIHIYICINTFIYIDIYIHVHTYMYTCILVYIHRDTCTYIERWGAGVETQKNVRGEIGEWGRVPFNEPYAPSLSTIYDGA